MTMTMMMIPSYSQCRIGCLMMMMMVLTLAIQLQQVQSFSNPTRILPVSTTTTVPRLQFTSLRNALFDDDDDDDDDEEEDDFIDSDSLGDWRTFRRNLTFEQDQEQDATTSLETTTTSSTTQMASTKPPKSVSKANEEILLQQNEKLAAEYLTGVWAHPVATVRMVMVVFLKRLVVVRRCQTHIFVSPVALNT